MSFYGFGGGNPEGEGAAGVGARKGCSFDPATPALMADVDTKRIDNVKVGDLVSATDPANGKIVGQRVTALHDDLDTDMADVTVADAHGHRSVVHTTQNHPFWDATTHRWTRADHLHHGDHLKSTTSATVNVVEVHTYTQPHHRLNLTVDTLHTYYVLAGDTPVLVHNQGPFCGVPIGKRAAGDADFHGSGYSLDEMVEFVHGHTGGGNPAMGRPNQSQIEAALRNAGPVRLGEQNAAKFEYDGVKVIINYDTPWRSTAYFPGR